MNLIKLIFCLQKKLTSGHLYPDERLDNTSRQRLQGEQIHVLSYVLHHDKFYSCARFPVHGQDKFVKFDIATKDCLLEGCVMAAV